MKSFLKACLVGALTSLSLQVWGADCAGGGASIILASQAQVTDFQTNYGGVGGCDTVTGLLVISGGDIMNLNGLASLVSVGVELDIRNNPALTNLDGLTNLVSVGHRMSIGENAILTSLTGLANLTSVGQLVIWNNAVLTNFDGLNRLTNVSGVFQIANNDALTNIDALSSLTNVGGVLFGGLFIENNNALTDVDGLASLTSVREDLEIFNNDVLTNLNGLANLTSLGRSLFIGDHAALSSCHGLSTLLDEIDDAASGPGTPPIPDVFGTVSFRNNLPGCNSVAEALTPPVVTSVPGLGPFALVLLTCLMLLGGITGVRRQT